MKRLLVAFLLLGGVAAMAQEAVWTNKNVDKPLQKTGIYIWWAQGLSRLPGAYRIAGRIKKDSPGDFTLKAADAITGESYWQKTVKVSDAFAELDFGEFDYDGTYQLLIADWNEPGFYLDYVKMTPIKLDEIPPAKQISADALDGWLAMHRTKIAIDGSVKKEGSGSLKVTVSPKDGEKWYDIGAIRRVSVAEMRTVSFWLRFEKEPCRIWINITVSDGSSVATVDPVQFDIKGGEWKLVEVPAANFSFRPVRNDIKNLRAISFSPEPQKSDCVFYLDDILFE